jgi:hypothetical protein
LDHETFNSFEGTVADQHAIAIAQEGPGEGWKTGTDDGPKCLNFMFRDRNKGSSKAYQTHNARRHEERQAAAYVKLAKDVSRKQSDIHVPDAVGQTAALAIERKI